MDSGVYEAIRWLLSGIGTQDHSHFIPAAGAVLPLNARSTGIFTAFALGVLLRALAGSLGGAVLPSRPVTITLLVLGTLGFADGLQAQLGEPLYRPEPLWRFWAGALIGVGGAFVALSLAQRAAGHPFEAEPLFDDLEGGLGALVLVLAGSGVLVATASVSSWPLALSAFVGVLVAGTLAVRVLLPARMRTQVRTSSVIGALLTLAVLGAVALTWGA